MIYNQATYASFGPLQIETTVLKTYIPIVAAILTPTLVKIWPTLKRVVSVATYAFKNSDPVQGRILTLLSELELLSVKTNNKQLVELSRQFRDKFQTTDEV